MFNLPIILKSQELQEIKDKHLSPKHLQITFDLSTILYLSSLLATYEKNHKT